ncbi:uncharacterized protein BXZ73DRAFT_16964, partial [Epithele typhae]|uniref:uncharacterized protein n=1 Tax=Epithele typhae TaxID=378194 RepID=UPI002008C7A5
MSSWNFVFQNGWYIGNNFNALLYAGVELVLYFQTVQTIMDGRRRREGHKFTHSDKTFLCLCTFFLCMITIYVVTQNFFGEEMWIINEGYPGGSGQYFDDHATVWYQVFGSTSWISLSLASDAFLIYRTFIVWSGLRHVIIVPCILYVGSLVMGIFTLIYSSKPGLQIIFSEASSHIALAYSSIGLALNITCTALICARILCVSHKLRRALGPSRLLSRALGADDAAAAGIGATAVIVESMLPYTCFGVAYVVTLGAGSPLSILFLSLYAMFNCLSPQMIILRVIAERGWRPERAS